MNNGLQMWDLYNTAKTYHVRPSDLLRVVDPFAAYCLDSACGEWGRTIEAELSRIEGKNQKEIDVKSDRVLRKYCGLPLRYRTPVATSHGGIPTTVEE